LRAPGRTHVRLCRVDDGGFKVLIKFGGKYAKQGRKRDARAPVRVLYTGGIHYDLLM
jgi:hypothetical protein